MARLVAQAAQAPAVGQIPLQRCGPVPCDCTSDERAEHAAAEPAAAVQTYEDGSIPLQLASGCPGSTIQRWPFSDDGEQEADKGSSGGVLDWIGERGATALDTVSDVASGAYETANAQAGAAFDTISDAASSAYEETTAAVGNVDIERKRASALSHISSYRQQLGELEFLVVSESQLGQLNGHLASLRDRSRGAIDIPGISADGTTADGETTIATGAIDSLLSTLQSALSGPAGPADRSAAQRSVQRLAGEELVLGGLVAGGAAGLGTVVAILAIIILIFLIIAAILHYSSKKSGQQPGTAPKPDPKGKKKAETGPETDPTDKKRKRCVTGADCRESTGEPCPEPLPLKWPRELPLPDVEHLIRVTGEDVDFPKERRGGAQARLRAEIAENRSLLLPPPRPCFPSEDLDPNAPRDAHHRLPLALGGRDADENLCSLEADAHQNGHPRLSNQSEFHDQYERECCYCTANINAHPGGQTYLIMGRK